MNRIFIIIFFLTSNLSFNKLNAQNFISSQFEITSTNLNPSLNGDFTGKLRISSAYRNQWRSILGAESYRTKFLAIDSKLPISNFGSIGYGVTALFTEAGSATFKRNKFGITSSYLHNLSTKKNILNQIGFGIEVGFSVRSLDITNSTFGINSPIYYPEVGSGIHWRFQKGERFTARVGYSVFHLNKPDISFSPNNEVKLNPRMSIHGELEIPIFTKLSLLPSFNINYQNPQSSQIVRLFGKILFGKQNWIQIGYLGRFGKSEQNENEFNTYGFGTIVKVHRYSLNFSFDRDISLKANSFEFGIGFIIF